MKKEMSWWSRFGVSCEKCKNSCQMFLVSKEKFPKGKICFVKEKKQNGNLVQESLNCKEIVEHFTETNWTRNVDQFSDVSQMFNTRTLSGKCQHYFSSVKGMKKNRSRVLYKEKD